METWFEVIGYAGAYSVSTGHRVRNNNTGKILKANAGSGPEKVNLVDEFTGRSKAFVIEELFHAAEQAARRFGIHGKTGSHFKS